MIQVSARRSGLAHEFLQVGGHRRALVGVLLSQEGRHGAGAGAAGVALLHELSDLLDDGLGLGPSQVVVFEDSALGLTAARRAGCAVVLLDNGTLEDAGELAAGVPVSTWPALPRPSGGAFSAPVGGP